MRSVLESLYPVRDAVLEHAALAGDETLLDVGCGDGLIGFGALEKLPDGKVIFSDVSQDLLDHTRELAEKMGAMNRCTFVNADAATLAPFDAGSVDVVTTRSVLIYVADKRGAFSAFYRVLRRGGILSIFEPINRFGHPMPAGDFWGFDVTPISDLAERVKAIYEAIQPLESDPMLNFDERDLFQLALDAGFSDVSLEYKADQRPYPPPLIDWEVYLDTAPNPRVPTLREAMTQALDPDEQRRFADHLRPVFERGAGTSRQAVAYLWAEK